MQVSSPCKLCSVVLAMAGSFSHEKTAGNACVESMWAKDVIDVDD